MDPYAPVGSPFIISPNTTNVGGGVNSSASEVDNGGSISIQPVDPSENKQKYLQGMQRSLMQERYSPPVINVAGSNGHNKLHELLLMEVQRGLHKILLVISIFLQDATKLSRTR